MKKYTNRTLDNHVFSGDSVNTTVTFRGVTGSGVTFDEPESIPTEDKTPWGGRTASVSKVKRGKTCKSDKPKRARRMPTGKMTSEIQRQLEALGFTRKGDAKASKKVSEHKNFKENKYIKRYKTRQRKQLTVEEAKGIIKRLYSQADKWDDPEFKMAFRRLTGQSKVMSLSEATGVVYQWYHFEAKRYQLEYSIACLLLSGIWIAPKTRLKEGMSKQIQARCDRRDLNAGFKGSWVYRN
ncbi:hypothetical protein QNZ73_004745 [Vibrio parahaemolyticus]|nr:hypothetical protein [Vibrio parahaemolyticus]